MLLRARHLLVALFTLGALQLALLGAGGVPGGGTEVGARGVHVRSESQVPSLGKRTLASELWDRHAPTTPFAPSALIRVDLPTPGGHAAPLDLPYSVASDDLVVLPPARAPPALS